MYARVLTAARAELGVTDSVVVHPYLALVADSAGRALARLDEFEYEPAAALRLFGEDSTVVLCEFDDRGMCSAVSYLVVSQMLRLAERDASIVVFAVSGYGTRQRYVLVNLRYRRNGWHIANTHSAI